MTSPLFKKNKTLRHRWKLTAPAMRKPIARLNLQTLGPYCSASTMTEKMVIQPDNKSLIPGTMSRRVELTTSYLSDSPVACLTRSESARCDLAGRRLKIRGLKARPLLAQSWPPRASSSKLRCWACHSIWYTTKLPRLPR